MLDESPETGPEAARRMQLRGLHHVTLICRDLERTTAFYRDLLGLGVVHAGRNDDDPDARHAWFGMGAGGVVESRFMEGPPAC